MRTRIVNGRWVLWVTDAVADWDAPTGSPELGTGWEYERLRSIQEHHHFGDCFYEIGAEAGWLSALIAREFVGAQNMVLMEPSREFWPDIRKTWLYNGLADPAACFCGFADSTSTTLAPPVGSWPDGALLNEPETAGMPYRSLANPDHGGIPAMRVDDFAYSTGLFPTSLNIDVEGAELRVLHGAEVLLRKADLGLANVFVSIHPDLLEGYGATPAQLYKFMESLGWQGEHLATDHEEHHLFTRRT